MSSGAFQPIASLSRPIHRSCRRLVRRAAGTRPSGFGSQQRGWRRSVTRTPRRWGSSSWRRTTRRSPAGPHRPVARRNGSGLTPRGGVRYSISTLTSRVLSTALHDHGGGAVRLGAAAPRRLERSARGRREARQHLITASGTRPPRSARLTRACRVRPSLIEERRRCDAGVPGGLHVGHSHRIHDEASPAGRSGRDPADAPRGDDQERHRPPGHREGEAAGGQRPGRRAGPDPR